MAAHGQILADEPIAVDTTQLKRAKNGRLVQSGVVHVECTFNNTRVVITDPQGNVLSWST
ncbi:MAG: 30S ribosomal protein S11, partial [Victivallales bacterium]|nr:30S ribosomal protein S11 [Victivallales bacterium]